MYPIKNYFILTLFFIFLFSCKKQEVKKNITVQQDTLSKVKSKFDNVDSNSHKKIYINEIEKNNITNIDKYSKDSAYFSRTFDINKDGILDKVISSNPYEGEDLLVYLGNKNSEYTLALRTINFSQDGGNQISDIKQTKDGFIIMTTFPDRGNSYSNYYISSSNNSFVLKKIEQKSHFWQDGYTETCEQNLNFDLKNTLESLSNTIAELKPNCTKKIDKKN